MDSIKQLKVTLLSEKFTSSKAKRSNAFTNLTTSRNVSGEFNLSKVAFANGFNEPILSNVGLVTVASGPSTTTSTARR
jgi:hypothetical protein